MQFQVEVPGIMLFCSKEQDPHSKQACMCINIIWHCAQCM